MKLTIISGAARQKSVSNTAAIIKAFAEGYEENGNTAEVYYLSERAQWQSANAAFEQNTFILIAFPLYVENLPGILLEFLSGLMPKQPAGETSIAFLLQGGFDEACQSRCCEEYLKMLPGKLGCRYAGTLLKGGNFGIRYAEGKQKEQLLTPWKEMGREFAKTHSFDTEAARIFAGDEYMKENEAKIFMRFGKYFMRIMMNRLSKKLGRKKSLMDRPYET